MQLCVRLSFLHRADEFFCSVPRRVPQKSVFWGRVALDKSEGVVKGIGILSDAWHTYQDYQACVGHP